MEDQKWDEIVADLRAQGHEASKVDLADGGSGIKVVLNNVFVLWGLNEGYWSFTVVDDTGAVVDHGVTAMRDAADVMVIGDVIVNYPYDEMFDLTEQEAQEIIHETLNQTDLSQERKDAVIETLSGDQ